MDEIDVYFSGDRVECLDCGKKFIFLGRHVVAAHMSVRDYKQRHGIPQYRGLCSAPLTAIRIKVGKDIHANRARSWQGRYGTRKKGLYVVPAVKRVRSKAWVEQKRVHCVCKECGEYAGEYAVRHAGNAACERCRVRATFARKARYKYVGLEAAP